MRRCCRTLKHKKEDWRNRNKKLIYLDGEEDGWMDLSVIWRWVSGDRGIKWRIGTPEGGSVEKPRFYRNYSTVEIEWEEQEGILVCSVDVTSMDHEPVIKLHNYASRLTLEVYQVWRWLWVAALHSSNLPSAQSLPIHVRKWSKSVHFISIQVTYKEFKYYYNYCTSILLI